MRSSKCLLLIVVVGVAIIALTGCRSELAQSEAQSTDLEDSWYLSFSGDKLVGWLHTIANETEGYYLTETTLELAISSDTSPLRIHLAMSFFEREDGRPIKAWSDVAVLGLTTKTEVDYAGSLVRKTVTDAEGAVAVTESEQHSAPFFMPVAQRRFVQERLALGVDEIEYSALILPDEVSPRVVRMSLSDEVTLDYLGEPTLMTVWLVSIEGLPDQVEYWSKNGDLIFRKSNNGLLSVLEVRVTEEQAYQAITNGLDGSSLFATTMLRLGLDKQIPNAQDTQSVTFRICTKDSAPPVDLPQAGGQSIAQSDSDCVLVTFSTRDPLPASEADLSNPAFLQSTALVDYDNEAVEELLANAAQASDSPIDIALGLRAFVYGFFDNDYEDIASYDSASQIAKSARGDCTEYAVLLTALLRGNGIPARIVNGYGYLDGGGDDLGWLWPHAWTQALIDGCWIDLDATLPKPTPDAARIITGFDEKELPLSEMEAEASEEDASTTMQLVTAIIEVLNIEY
jgi:transglutaminase-like putative cysteine protease